MGPKERRSTFLSAIEEAAIVSLRVQARSPLDDVYIALNRGSLPSHLPHVEEITEPESLFCRCGSSPSINWRHRNRVRLEVVNGPYERRQN